MTDNNQEPNRRTLAGSEDDALDRQLDAALALYAAVEPRAELEERILANLRAEPAEIAPRFGLRWGFAMSLAAVLVIAVLWAWRAERPRSPEAAQHPSVVQSPKPSPPHVVANDVVANDEDDVVRNVTTPAHTVRVRHSRPPAATVATTNPKLDVFPSPRPLSEQERVLADYVAQFQRQAVLMARVTDEELQRDRKEILDPAHDLAGFGNVSEPGPQKTTGEAK